MTPTVFLFYIMAPHVGLLPVPNSPAFTDVASCELALNKADPFLPGKTACWPAPWHAEAVLDRPTGAPVDPGEHID